jgi:hypothetical protein
MKIFLYPLVGTFLGLFVGLYSYWHAIQASKNSWCGGYVMLSLGESLITFGVMGLIMGLFVAALVKKAHRRKSLQPSSNVLRSSQ